MPADKFVTVGTTGLVENPARTTSAGSVDAGKLIALDSSGRFDTSVMPVGIGAQTQTLVASETLAAGAVVNIWSDAGTQKVRNADGSTSGKPADGFVQSGFSSGASALVYGPGAIITGLSGLTPGPAFLSATVAGGVASTGATGAGQTFQRVGTIASPTTVLFNPQTPVTRA